MTDQEILELYIEKFFKVSPEDGVPRRGLLKFGKENFTTWREILTALYYSKDINEAAKELHYGTTRGRNEDAPRKGMEGSLSKKTETLGMSWVKALGKDNQKAWFAHIQQSVGVNTCTICNKTMGLENFKLLNELGNYSERYTCDVYRNECEVCYLEKMKPITAKWKKEHPHVVNDLSARRRAKIAKTYNELSSEDRDKVLDIYEESSKLNKEAGYIKYHVDHICPLSKGGTHSPDNLQILLAEDNLKKSDKWEPKVAS